MVTIMTRKLLVLWCFAGPVLADSAVGVATLPGNTLNPSGVQTEEKDPRGLSLIKPTRSRSSTGLLYHTPPPPPEDQATVRRLGILGPGGSRHIAGRWRRGFRPIHRI